MIDLFWKAVLSDGIDFCELQEDSPNSWHKLKDYCEEHKLQIENLSVVFRSHEVTHDYRHPTIPIGGWFFSKKCMSYNIGGPTEHAYVIGSLHGDQVYVTVLKVPELVVLETEIRNKQDCRMGLIEHPVKASLKASQHFLAR